MKKTKGNHISCIGDEVRIVRVINGRESKLILIGRVIINGILDVSLSIRLTKFPIGY